MALALNPLNLFIASFVSFDKIVVTASDVAIIDSLRISISLFENFPNTWETRSPFGPPTPILTLGNTSLDKLAIMLFIPLCPPWLPFSLILNLPTSKLMSSYITIISSLDIL